MPDDPELTPEEQAAFDRVAARSVRPDPVTLGILNRASEIERRGDSVTVTIKEVLEALLHAPIKPALINHLKSARSVTEDENGDEIIYLDDIA